MTDRQQEQIALHALDALTPEEVRVLESEWRYEARLREEYAELSEVAAEIAHLMPAETPPADVREQLLATLKRQRRAKVTPISIAWKVVRSPWVAWAAAAVIAVSATGLWTANRELNNRVTTLVMSETAAQGEVADARKAQDLLKTQVADADARYAKLLTEAEQLRKGIAVASMEVSMLRASVKRYEEGEVLVVWDQTKQEGLIKLAHMPSVQPGKDYQLWVICKRQQTPVNAGVVKVNEKGEATVVFHPSKHIAEVSKFAVSLEKEGGAPEVEGPVILASK
ncbi:anti-sigma-K factor rskA [Roseimicrobium gellanilyticum]|uniref:Regulator of SigK n=1 Tax=Roseimicrobium gellanilyticum TaxID=748857 RepID=A0A366HT39_9BACT|nr:anti-sigma factor [Roseimicrobium gellanilyticum]RBP47432.1 anti-sigma-K factor rskA [Roseimicrobium gellanilyticum]